MSRPERLDARRRCTACPASSTTAPSGSPARSSAKLRHAAAGRTRGCSSPTPTAAPAARSMRCSPSDGVDRLPGEHCYEFFAGRRAFAAMHEDEPGHVLPDRLPRPALRAGWSCRASASIAHPELLPMYFGNYRRVVYLARPTTRRSIARARGRGAPRLGLAFEHRPRGYGELAARRCAAGSWRCRAEWPIRADRRSGGATSPRRWSPRTAARPPRVSCTGASRRRSTGPRCGRA